MYILLYRCTTTRQQRSLNAVKYFHKRKRTWRDARRVKKYTHTYALQMHQHIDITTAHFGCTHKYTHTCMCMFLPVFYPSLSRLHTLRTHYTIVYKHAAYFISCCCYVFFFLYGLVSASSSRSRCVYMQCRVQSPFCCCCVCVCMYFVIPCGALMWMRLSLLVHCALRALEGESDFIYKYFYIQSIVYMHAHTWKCKENQRRRHAQQISKQHRKMRHVCEWMFLLFLSLHVYFHFDNERARQRKFRSPAHTFCILATHICYVY